MALNPVLVRTGSLLRAAGPVFSGSLQHCLLSVWLHDTAYTNAPPSQHHTFNIDLEDTNVDPSRWFGLGIGVDNFNNVTFSCVGHSPSESCFNRTFLAPGSWPACTTHMLASVDFTTGAAQVYINDAPLTLETASNIGPTASISSGVPFASSVTVQENMPHGDTYVSDLWFGQTGSYIDLTVTANRRKFINADGTPANLGPSGALPFGTVPTLFQTIPAGGAATDFLTNRGSIGGTLTTTATIMTVGDPCAPPPVPASSLAMDNVLAFAAVKTSNLVFLEWSDDRAHSWGNPVSQPIGDRGEYLTSASWSRLGYARDRCFRLTWSVPVATALQGAFISLDSSAKS